MRFLDLPGLTSQRFALLLLGVTVGYLMVLACAGAVRARWAIAGIVAVHAVFLLAPPLLSGDVFSYLQYARLGTVHGLNPYADAPTGIPGDLAYRFASEHRITSPYGPLWTLVSDAAVPFGVQAGLWALKALGALASLGLVALVWRGARRAGRDPVGAALLVGLNPLIVLYAVGGAHNDLLMMLLAVAGVVLLTEPAVPRPALGGAALAAATAVKASAALLVPFALLGTRGEPRWRALAGMLAAAAVVLLAALVAFGVDALNLVDVLGTEQQRRALNSVPRAVSRALGSGGLSEGVRAGFGVAFGAVAIALLIWVRRGADWVTAAGWATLALLLSTAWLLPWYGAWLMPLAALSGDRRLRFAAVAFTAVYLATKIVPGLR
ncbi:MAG TPA: glycosyltransferase 87 family protein [Solirubrobacteraceae bacterium]|nr:glycosyltransferase 87 family protein [Solirubrobacteraceae bacterium]